MKSSGMIALAVTAALLAGCQKGSQHEPATAPVALPAPLPATQPAMATIQVDQQPVLFPQAVLRFSIQKGSVIARLSSDDPPDAIQDNYHGNSFDLIMALNISDPSQIDQAVWEFSSDSQPQRESTYGIFLDGQRRRLHPQDVVASFSRDGDRVIVDVKGVFFEYGSDDPGRAANPAPRVLVQGRLDAVVDRN